MSIWADLVFLLMFAAVLFATAKNVTHAIAATATLIACFLIGRWDKTMWSSVWWVVACAIYSVFVYLTP